VRRRFFVKQFAGKGAFIAGETAHHLSRVLRAQAGQLYELSDGNSVWLGRIERIVWDRVEFALVEEIPVEQPGLNIVLLLSIVKFDAFEWALEKATELGVSRIVPLAAVRSEKALLAAAEKRAVRWNKILVEASQQSRRLELPVLEPAAPSESAFGAVTAGMKLLLSERREAGSLRQALDGSNRAAAVALAIGPEGGWTEQEFTAARAAGFREASLGRLILRTETAVITALASLNYALGD
jgi:16S rRNA (uracil1498-N3)-methyltransferase